VRRRSGGAAKWGCDDGRCRTDRACAPSDYGNAVEIPTAVKERLGLDQDRSRIVTNEVNVFTWPGFDLRPIDTACGFTYGFLPRGLANATISAVRTHMRLGKAATIGREEPDAQR
jgi:hypothetical protein